MNKRWFARISFVIVILVFIGVLVKLTSGTSDSAAQNKWDKLNQQQLVQEVKAANVTVVDLREPSLFKKGHIPQAINIPFEDFQNRYKELDPNKRIIFVCHDGPMGDASAQFLQEKGYTHLANLQGGMSAWKGSLVQ